MFIRRVLKTVFLGGGGFDLRAPRSRRSKSNLPQRWGFSTRGVYIIFLVECTEIRAFWGIEHQKKIQSTFPFFNHHHHFYFGAGNFGFILFSFLKNLTFPFLFMWYFCLKNDPDSRSGLKSPFSMPHDIEKDKNCRFSEI